MSVSDPHHEFIEQASKGLSKFVSKLHPLEYTYWKRENLIWVYMDPERCYSTCFHAPVFFANKSFTEYKLVNKKINHHEYDVSNIIDHLRVKAENLSGVQWPVRNFEFYVRSMGLDKPLHALRSKAYQAARRALPKIMARDFVLSMHDYDPYFANKLRQQCITELSKALVLKNG